MLKIFKWVGVLSAIILMAACFMNWLQMPVVEKTITGMNTEGTHYGKPGYIHIVIAALFIIFSFIQNVSVKRINVMLAGFNIAWAFRNFMLLAACSGGECPTRLMGLYLVMITSSVMMLASLFPDIKIKADPEENP